MGRTASRVPRRAPSLRAVTLTVGGVALFYATALLGVACAYRKGYGIVGKPELALLYVAKSLASISSSRTRSERTLAAVVDIAL